MNVDIPDEAKAAASLIHNVGLGVRRDAPATSLAMLRRAFGMNPFDTVARVNLAALLADAGNDDEAEALVAPLIGQKVDFAYQIMGVVATHRGQLQRAIEFFEVALALAPDNGQRRFDLAAAYLRAGDFARGLPLYEDRHMVLPRSGPTPDAPKWTGEKTGHLAVWGDQGYGDRIQFARFLPWARERCDKLTFLTDPATVVLLSGYADAKVCDVSAHIDPAVKFDAQVSLASLPLLYGITADNIPPDPGYLNVAAATDELAAGGLKIGIAWAGNREHPNDNIRSMPFDALLPIAADPRNDIFSLQCGAPAADIARARAQRIVRDMSGIVEGEWAHAATVIRNLDLVVTVDTAIAHLAGAMGVPVFLMLPVFSDWRWLLGRDDSPWYPSMRLFRQRSCGDWAGVVAQVCDAVTEIHSDRKMAAMLGRDVQHPLGQVPGQEYEPDVTHVMRRVLRSGDTFVDVGANVGKHTVLGAELVGDAGRVFAFEPGSNNLPALRAAIGECNNVVVVPAAAWSERGKLKFYENADDGGGNSVWSPADWPGPQNPKCRANPPDPVTIEATTLDFVLSLEAPRLIKIDVEGAEQRVLEGARSIFGDGPSNIPFIIAELHEFGLQKLGCSQQSLRALMERHGYSTFLLFSDGSLPQLVPPATTIKSGLILNLLFSTPEAVGEVWSDKPIEFAGLRPMYAYGVREASAA